MRRIILALLGSVLFSTLSFAADPVTVTELLSTKTTNTGQPIVLPQHDAQLLVSRYTIPAGVSTPIHKHPSQRYVQVLSGHVAVTFTDTSKVFEYKAGDFFAEAQNEWHFGTAVGDEAAVILVIDQVEAGQKNVVLRDQN